MSYVKLSSFSNAELEAHSHAIINEHGQDAPGFINRLVAEADAAGEFVEHAKGINVAFGVPQILRPDPRLQ